MTATHLANHQIITTKAQFCASPVEVFAVWADTAHRFEWEPTPEGMQTHYLNFDFRVGGVETSEMRQESAVAAQFVTRYLDIVPDYRVIFSVTVLVEDVAVTCSQNTIELVPNGTGTTLHCHELVVWLHGHDLRPEHQRGWKLMFERMVDFVDR
ncbi:MAG: hypothetical protein ACI9O0_000814 [Paracoccaceae bacterium]|jgi:uncharacterized protein YndB with AHSA1/START domain